MNSRPDWRGMKTLLLWVLLCGVCMTVMLWWAAGKSIVIADASPREQEDQSDPQEQDVLERYRLTLEAEEGKARRFCIPLDPAIRGEQISIENRYTDRQLWIYIQGARASDYRDYVITGDLSSMVGGWAQQQGEMTVLKLQMNTVQEYSSLMEENRLYVEYAAPEECYDRIVVIDPRGGGEDSGLTAEGRLEKEITLQIARAVKRLLEGSDIKAYFTRLEDSESTAQDRAFLVREVNADLYVGISVNEAPEDPEQFGTEVWYNGDYFIPQFGNLQLADLLERQVTEAVVGRANGLVQAEDPVLQQLTVPGALLKAGYLTHEQEGELLAREGYTEKIAEGIVAALQQAFAESEEE